MRESFGGTLMLRFVLIFFVMYVTFLAIAMNFAKIYRIKNNVINILEQGRYSGSMESEVDIKDNLNSYFSKTNYVFYDSSVIEDIRVNCTDRFDDDVSGTLYSEDGHYFCIVNHGFETNPYYTVVIYQYIDLHLLDIHMLIPAVGETTVIKPKLGG